MNDGKRKTAAGTAGILKMVYAALYLAIALALPFVTGQIPQIGSMLLPMHIPVFMCGFMCGWPWGLAVGLIAPLMRSALFGMPALFPSAVAMTFELAAYGGFSGWLHARLNGKTPYAALIISMVAGRLVWGAARVVLAGMSQNSFTWALFLSGAITNAVPGIILQLVLIPALVVAMERAGLSLNRDAGRKHGR